MDELDWGEAKRKCDSKTKSGLLLKFMDYDEDLWNACAEYQRYDPMNLWKEYYEEYPHKKPKAEEAVTTTADAKATLRWRR